MSWLGVDLGGTWLRADGYAAERVDGRGPALLIEHLAQCARSQGCDGIAISFAGWLDGAGAIVAGPNLGWGAVDLAPLCSAYGLDCHLENDVDARAWGEWLRLSAAARQAGDLMVINAGTGFALGLVLGGRLCRGVHRRAGEIGHLRIGANERCGCGAIGCLETVVGGAHFTPEALDDGAKRAAWIDAASAVLAPVIAAIDPAHILVVGGVLEARPALLDGLQTRLRAQLPEAWWGDLSLRPCAAAQTSAREGVVDLASSKPRESVGGQSWN